MYDLAGILLFRQDVLLSSGARPGYAAGRFVHVRAGAFHSRFDFIGRSSRCRRIAVTALFFPPSASSLLSISIRILPKRLQHRLLPDLPNILTASKFLPLPLILSSIMISDLLLPLRCR